MCRLFGFRSVINSQVHQSLIHADNALESQSEGHPDGWGVSYYIAGAPHIVKSIEPAFTCNLFKKISGLVTSQTVMAHIRKATLGEKNIVNTHPFQYGHWTFAHNGNIKNFEKHREKIHARVPKDLSKFILGTTDSELLFYFLLGKLSEDIDLHQKEQSLDIVNSSIQKAINELISIIGNFSKIDDAGATETYLTFILTNGKVMLAHQGGKHLYYSTYKTRCLDREFCRSFSPECESATQSGFVNHLIFSSEPLSGENIWLPMRNSQLIGVDHNMKLFISSN